MITEIVRAELDLDREFELLRKPFPSDRNSWTWRQITRWWR